MQTTTEPLTWHQAKAARWRHKLRNHSAHIKAPGWIHTGLTLCGRKDPPVMVDAEHRHNPANKCCARCKRIADKAKT